MCALGLSTASGLHFCKKKKENAVQQSVVEASECFLKQAGHFSKAVIGDNMTSELSVGHSYVPFTLADQIACHCR